MAVVGEARIVVRAITTGVADEITRALKQAQANVEKEGEALGQRLSDGFSKGFGKKKKGGIFGDLFDEDKAEAARAKFASLQKAGMTMQTAFGTLAGSIGSLVVALGALVGSAGGAASALVAVAGAGIGAGIGMKLAGMALSGVTGPLKAVDSAGGRTKKTIAELREEMQQLRFDAEEAALSEKEAALNLEKARENLARVQDLPPNSMARREAELSYEQADLALRRAIDRNNDLQEEIKNGPKQDSGAGNDPYKGLTESQKDFAKTLVKLKPKFDDLKEAVAKGFLPILGDQIETLFTTNFPTLLRMFTGIGKALGDATDKVFTFINSTDGMALFESLFKNSEGVIRDLGDTLALTMESLLIVLREAAPLTEAFTGWLKESATTFNTFVKDAAGNGDMKKFFEDAGRVAGDFGEIFGNIFGGIKDLISDSLNLDSGGDDLIQWLKGVTAGFASIGENPGFSKFLKDSAANAIKMFDALGEIFGIILGMADDPAIGEFWDTIAKAAEPLKDLLENGSKAGDELADLIVQITEIAAAFGDSGQLEAFFGTLRDIAKSFADLLNTQWVKEFLGWFGPIAGTLLAFGTALKVAAFGFRVMLGTFNMFAAPFKFFFTKDIDSGMTKWQELKTKTKQTFDSMKEAVIKAKDKIKDAFTAIKDFGKQAFQDIKQGVTLWKDAAVEKFKQFKEAAGKAFDSFKETATKAFNTLKDAAKTALDNVKTGLTLWKDAAVEKFNLFKQAASNAFNTLKEVSKTALDNVKTGLALWKDAAVEKMTAFKDGASAAFTALKDKASTVFSAIGGWAKDAGAKLAGVGTSIWGATTKAASAIGDLSKKIALNTIAVFKNIGAWIAQKAALIGSAIATAAMTVAQTALRIATAIGTAIQAAFNFVMAMNPITLIIIAIVALVAALIWFFTQTELGKQLWQGFVDFLIGLWNGVLAFFGGLGQFFADLWNGIVNGIVAAWNWVVDGIKAAIDWVVGIFVGAWNGVVNFFKGFVNGLIGMFEGFVNFVIDGLNNFMKPLRDAINGILSTLGVDFQFSVIPNVKLPRLAKGGVVSPSPGGSLVNVAEAGRPERIEPLDENGMSKRDKVLLDAMSKGGGSGVNITVNPSAGMDEVELSNLVSRQLAFQLRAGGV